MIIEAMIDKWAARLEMSDWELYTNEAATIVIGTIGPLTVLRPINQNDPSRIEHEVINALLQIKFSLVVDTDDIDVKDMLCDITRALIASDRQHPEMIITYDVTEESLHKENT